MRFMIVGESGGVDFDNLIKVDTRFKSLSRLRSANSEAMVEGFFYESTAEFMAELSTEELQNELIKRSPLGKALE